MASFYHSDGIAEIPFIADVDLEDYQWRLVQAASATSGNVASATGGCNPTPLGILTNSPSSGQEATVKVLGFTKARCRPNACGLTFGTYLMAASNASLEPVGTLGSPVMARWFGPNKTTAGASVYGSVLFYGGLAACNMASGS
jgi:hypothetical protein